MTDREKVINQIDVDIQRAERTGEMLVHVGRKTAKDALTLLKEQEAVVQCKDCTYWHESETHKGYGDCGQANGITLKSSDWFCADGKRR